MKDKNPTAMAKSDIEQQSPVASEVIEPSEEPLPFDIIADLGDTVARLSASEEKMPSDKQALFSLFKVAHGLALRCANEAKAARDERDRYKAQARFGRGARQGRG